MIADVAIMRRCGSAMPFSACCAVIFRCLLLPAMMPCGDAFFFFSLCYTAALIFTPADDAAV